VPGSQLLAECFGGPLDGERRPVRNGFLRHKERCEYATHHPEHLFPVAIYTIVDHRKHGVIWEFEGMEP
jgi:hypothetical protein